MERTCEISFRLKIKKSSRSQTEFWNKETVVEVLETKMLCVAFVIIAFENAAIENIAIENISIENIAFENLRQRFGNDSKGACNW